MCFDEAHCDVTLRIDIRGGHQLELKPSIRVLQRVTL